MRVYQVVYLRKNNTKKTVIVLRDESASVSIGGSNLDEQIAATDDKFAQIVGIERLHDPVVIELC